MIASYHHGRRQHTGALPLVQTPMKQEARPDVFCQRERFVAKLLLEFDGAKPGRRLGVDAARVTLLQELRRNIEGSSLATACVCTTLASGIDHLDDEIRAIAVVDGAHELPLVCAFPVTAGSA